MTKEEALNEFLKSLRVALTNSLAYPKDHPYFQECVNAFRDKAAQLFAFISPIKVIFTPDSLFADGKVMEKASLYVEIAQIFHQRKIKGIEIGPNVSIEELAAFLSAIALPVRELFKQGGMKKVLVQANLANISIEELDYSQILRGTGEIAGDVWVSLIKEAVEQNDRDKILKFADEFQKQVAQFRAKDLLEDDELRQNLAKFLEYLKNYDREKSGRFSLAIFKTVLKNKDILQGEKIDKIKSLFKHLNEEDFASLLKDEILKDQNFDALSFHLFSRISGANKDKAIAAQLFKDLSQENNMRENPMAVKKLQDLLAITNNQFISEVYRNTLSALIKGVSLEPGRQFDRAALDENYHYIILGLFAYEEHKSKLGIILEKLGEEFELAAKAKDFEYIKNILNVLKAKRKKFPADAAIFDKFDRRVSDFVENAVWNGIFNQAQENFLAGALERPSAGVDYYLSKIFQEHRTHPVCLRLFFRFFPTDIEIFYKAIEVRFTDIALVMEIAASLSAVNSPQANLVLRKMLSCGSTFLRIKILSEMQVIDETDKEFLVSILEKPDVPLKKEALLILAKHNIGIKEAVDKLLSVFSPFGIANAMLIENIGLISDANIREAAPELYVLARRHFFWNKNVRDKAGSILEIWDAR